MLSAFMLSPPNILLSFKLSSLFIDPVIVIDVHEHAYFRDYLNDRKAYVYAMMKELRWDVIEERFKRADGIAATLR